jgi:hypothetical protein
MCNEVMNLFGVPEAGSLKAANARAALEHFGEDTGWHYDFGKCVEHARQETEPPQDHHSRYIKRKPLRRADWYGSSPAPGEGRYRRSFPRVGCGGIANEIAQQHVNERRAEARPRDQQWHFTRGDGVADGARMLRPFGLL